MLQLHVEIMDILVRLSSFRKCIYRYTYIHILGWCIGRHLIQRCPLFGVSLKMEVPVQSLMYTQ